MSDEAEAAVLGAILSDGTVLRDVIGIVGPLDFYREGHRLIYEAMVDLFNDDKPVDDLTVTALLRAHRHLERCGGAYGVSILRDALPSVGNVIYYAELVRASALRRQLSSLSSRAQEVSSSEVTGAELSAELGRIHAELVEIVTRSAGTRGGWENLPTLGSQVLATAEAIADGGVVSVGIPTGLREVDDHQGGMRPGHLVILGGRPSTGKTALALQVSERAARAGNRVAMFSLEMSKDQLVQRVLASATELWTVALVSGRIQSEARVLLRAAVDGLPGEFWIDDTGGLSILDLRARARRLSMRGKLDIIVVDYLTLVHASRRGRTREQEVAEVVQGCKEMAKELECPVLALSQLSRRSEQDGRPPRLSDLRESGSIEQDADSVLLLHRPSLEEPKAELWLAKNRHGPVGSWLRCSFDGLRGRFEVVGYVPRKKRESKEEAEDTRYGRD